MPKTTSCLWIFQTSDEQFCSGLWTGAVLVPVVLHTSFCSQEDKKESMHETYCDYVCSVCISVPRHLKGITNTEATQAPSIGTEYKVRLKEFSFDLWSSLLTSLLPPPPPPPPPTQTTVIAWWTNGDTEQYIYNCHSVSVNCFYGYFFVFCFCVY